MITNRLVFKRNDGYKLELLKIENMKFFGSRILCTFMSSKSYAYLLNVKTSNLVSELGKVIKKW